MYSRRSDTYASCMCLSYFVILNAGMPVCYLLYTCVCHFSLSFLSTPFLHSLYLALSLSFSLSLSLSLYLFIYPSLSHSLSILYIYIYIIYIYIYIYIYLPMYPSLLSRVVHESRHLWDHNYICLFI